VLRRAHSWIGTVYQTNAPPHTLTQVNELFTTVAVATMRNWTHAYATLAAADSPMRDQIRVHPLPEGTAGRYHVLVGFQLAVSRYSRHPELAKRLMARFTSHDGQRRHALEAGFFPSRQALWQDPAVAKALPHRRPLMAPGAVNA
jgi:trehalose/maltose transport system substrate-binding protein